MRLGKCDVQRRVGGTTALRKRTSNYKGMFHFLRTAMGEVPIKIAVADDHSLVLSGFQNLFSTNLPHVEVFVAADKSELLELLQTHTIDILFQDVRFGRHDAREFVRSFRDTYPHMKIIAISTLNDEATVNLLVKQGVHGYVSKADGEEEIMLAVKAVMADQTYFSTSIRDNIPVHRLMQPSKVVLTPREKEVLSAIISGKTIKEAADELFLSEKTIETYRANLFLKFDVTHVASLVKRAILEGYL